MPLHILGLNHTTAPVEIREQVIYSGDDITRALGELVQLQGIDEAVLLSTCNRTEFYLETDDSGLLTLESWLKSDQSLSQDAEAALFTLDNEEAIRHLFRVACGLDSMVLGEPQILG